MANRPLIIFVLCWVAGSAAAAAGLAGWRLAGAAAALLALLLAFALYSRVSFALAFVCVIGFSLAGAERVWVDSRNISGLQDALDASAREEEVAVRLAGTIHTAIEIDGDRVQFDVMAQSVHINGEKAPRGVQERLLVQLKLEKPVEADIARQWRRGNRIELAGLLEQPLTASNFGGFDYRHYLQERRVHGFVKVTGTAHVKIDQTMQYNIPGLLGRVDTVRDWLGMKLEALYTGEHSGYMKGLLIGVRDDLDQERYRQFSQLGLTHILAISGLHIAVFLFMIQRLLKILRLTREQTMTGMIAAIPAYMLISGGSPSVVRAGIMAMLGLLAARFGKLKDGLHVLAAAALIMLVYDPLLLHNIGFQLSFLVTAGLILIVPPFRNLLPQGKRWKWLLDTAAVTVVAQAVSLPITLYYFNQFHLLSFLANFLLIPFISVFVIPLGGVSLLLSLLYVPAGKAAAYAVEACNRLSYAIVEWLNQFDRFRFIFATPPLWWIALYYIILLLCARCWVRLTAESVPLQPNSQQYTEDETIPLAAEHAAHAASANAPRSKQRKALLPGTACLILLPLIGAYYLPLISNDAIVSFIDVGQGDAILVRTAGGKHLLIDGGGQVMFRKAEDAWRTRRDPFEVGRKVVVPLLLQRGVQAIDLLVISHLDSDHIKGLLAVVDTIPIRHVLWNGTFKESADSKALLDAIASRDIPMYRAVEGRQWQLDSHTKLTIIGGADEGLFAGQRISEASDQNAHSVALILQLYDRTFLFAGDAEAQSERKMLLGAPQLEAAGLINDAAIDVMKLSHHGSKTSSIIEWLQYWQPQYAAISVGRRNLYRHPSPEVLERVEQLGIPIYRTDKGGEIQFKITDSNSLIVRNKRGVL